MSDRTRLIFRKGGEPFYQCLDCSFRFQVPAVNANLMATHDDFDKAYIQYLEETPEDTINFTDLLKRLHLCAGDGVRVLDVGCGSGKFVKFLRARSIEAYGLEPSPALYREYLSHFPYFLNTTVEELAETWPGAFDVLTALDVVEHVERPRDFIMSCSRLLKPHGVFLVSTPDVKSIPAKLFARRWHFYHKWHLSYFSRPVLESTLTSAGFLVHEAGHCGRRRSLGYTLQYAVNYLSSGTSISVPAVLNRIALPINTFDVLYVQAEKKA
ncbi:MAG: methyltransferase domain-containing protein [Acidobacteriia bacterium]|nr:methyltransferase domain-containing protein [Terriglobia bacterium]